MARSVWKGPFIEPYVLAKAEKVRASGKTGQIIQIWSRKSTIIPDFVGYTFGVHNGKKFIPVLITEEMVGHKFGEFALTRHFAGHSGHRKEEKKPAAGSK
jgi:small subunit ribosomal protein S19